MDKKDKKCYRIFHTDKSGLRNFEAYPISKEGIKDYLDFVESVYGKWARDNAKVI